MRYKNELTAALLKEIEMTASGQFPTLRDDEEIETIYFGGGTPSLLSNDELIAVLQRIRENYMVSLNAEVTLEANPDDISAERLLSWKAAGINRLSIGVQSFFEEDLRWMNRAHNSEQAIECLRLATSMFDNITMDLIYGSPGLTNEKWKHNVDTALSFGIPHISCYALTVEPKTPLQKMIHQHKLADVDPDNQSEQFLLLMDWLEAAGFEHYEISNFAKPGYRSRHNSAYWNGSQYLGLGPSAHSFDGKRRWWNIANNSLYIRSIEAGEIPFEIEELTPTQQVNEYIMISLRTSAGADLIRIARLAEPMTEGGERFMDDLGKKLRKYREKNLVELEGDRIKLTKEGRLLADGIAADLFAED